LIFFGKILKIDRGHFVNFKNYGRIYNFMKIYRGQFESFQKYGDQLAKFEKNIYKGRSL